MLRDVEAAEVHRLPSSVLPQWFLENRIPRLALDRLMVPDLQRGWLPILRRKVEEVLSKEKVDLVFTTCAPFSLNLAGEWIKEKYGIPWVTDFRDPWTMGTTFQAATPLHRWWNVRLERRAYARCDFFVANTEMFLAQERRRYPWLEPKAACVSNGFDPDDFANAVRPERKPGEWNLVFNGSWHRRFYTDHLFRAVQAFREKHPDVRLMLHYSGPHFAQFSAPARALGLDSVLVNHGYLSYLEVVKLLQSSDLLLFTIPSNERAESWVPAKLYEYLASGRPVFGVCPQGDAARLVNSQGECVDPMEADFAAKGLGALERLWKGADSGRSPSMPENELKNFQYPALAARLAGIFNRLTAVSPHK